MANDDHARILEEDGVHGWNDWRDINPDVIPDLREADLGSNPKKLKQPLNLVGVKLHVADLTGANLFGVDFRSGNLKGANLSHSDLRGANLSHCDLSESDLKSAKLRGTIFGNTDLHNVHGLDECDHYGPSIIDMFTIRKSWPLPISFLRACGLDDSLIAYLPNFVGHAIEYYSCFISYSHEDQDFAQCLYSKLQDRGVRCWFAPEDMKIGDRIRYAIDDAIRLRDKLLIVLSVHSISSNWVETEVEAAFEEEKERGTTVLFPIRIDDAVMATSRPWARQIRHTRHIGDFTEWKDHDCFQMALRRLLGDLKIEPIDTRVE